MKEDLFFLGVKALVTRPDGMILVVRLNKAIRNERNPEGWDIPGGRIKQGETIDQTLTREIQEEIGLAADPKFTLVGMIPTPMRLKALDREVGLIFGIYSYLLDKEIEVTLGGEHEAYEWVSAEVVAQRLSPILPAELNDKIAALKR